jgi:arylsulfatase A-like enzyme
MNVRCSIAWAILALLSIQGSLLAAPNIVLILADDLGVNDLHCYGRAEHQTPNLDRLAAEGRRFTAAYVTQPICSASRASIMTGKHPARLHLTTYLPGRGDAPSQKLRQPTVEGQLPLEEITLAEMLSQLGYATGMFGKWHLGGKGFGPIEQGFDQAELLPENADPASTAGGKNEFAITDVACRFMEDHQDQPFFCYVAHHSPHIRLASTPALMERHADAFHPTYAGMIETLDESIGRLLAKIDSLGLKGKTIVIFTSDNGGLHVLESPGTPATHNTPFRAGKGYLHEGGVRVPLIVRMPGSNKPGAVDERAASLIDLVPTIVSAAGGSTDKLVGPLDGKAKLFDEDRPIPTLYWHFPHYTNQGGRPAAAIRRQNWKLVEQLEDNSVELFDLASDPSESKNLAHQNPDDAQSLLNELHQWQKRIGADMPKANGSFDESLHRSLYVDVDSSKLIPAATAALTEPAWKNWRKQMNAAVQGARPEVTPAQGDIRLFARDARIHARTMRYEDAPHKNVLGFWTNPADWAEWSFDLSSPGRYEVEVQYGCGTGSGGSIVRIDVAGQSLEWTVTETGHFQSMIQQTIGEVDLPEGPVTVEVRPQSKPGPAVMDLRRVVLRPVVTPIDKR